MESCGHMKSSRGVQTCSATAAHHEFVSVFVFGAHFFSFPLHKKEPRRVFLVLTNEFVSVLRS